MSSNNCAYCYICFKILDFNWSNICSQVSIHTKTPIKTFLEQFSDHLIETEDEIGICYECQCKLNDYDLACLTAKNIEKDLRDLYKLKKFFIKPEPEIIIKDEENASDLKENEIIDNDYREFKSEDQKPNEEHDAKQIKIEKKCKVRTAKRKNEQQILKKTGDIEVTKTKVPRIRKPGKKRKRRVTSLISDSVVPPDLKCTICSIQTASIIGYKNHLRTHKNNPTEKHGYCCRTCGISHTNQIDLDAHIEKHKLVGMSKLQCVECGKEVTTRNSLFAHTAMHNGEKIYVCDLCGKGFIHRSSFRTHKNSHSKIKTKPCPICGRCFSQTTHLKGHIITHTGEKPYECSVCNRKFNKSYNMRQHMKTHDEKSSENSHVCVICNQSYLRTQYLRAHMKKHHQMVTTDDLVNQEVQP